jgi:hypothetical protein
MTNTDCYFFVDIEVPEKDRTMSVLCVPCHDEKMPDTGWFYKGSKEGYGPFDYKCSLCGSIIHSQGDHDNKDES